MNEEIKENEEAPAITPDEKQLPGSLDKIVSYGKTFKKTAQNQIFTEEKANTPWYKFPKKKKTPKEVKKIDKQIMELTKRRFDTKSNNVFIQLDYQITKLILEKQSLLDK